MENESKSNSLNNEDNGPKIKNIELNHLKNSGNIYLLIFLEI